MKTVVFLTLLAGTYALLHAAGVPMPWSSLAGWPVAIFGTPLVYRVVLILRYRRQWNQLDPEVQRAIDEATAGGPKPNWPKP